MADWYAHVTWSVEPSSIEPTETAGLLLDAVTGTEGVPGAVGYVNAPDDRSCWSAGWGVTAGTAEAADATARGMLAAAAVYAGQTGVQITRVEVFGEAERSRWRPRIPGMPPPGPNDR